MSGPARTSTCSLAGTAATSSAQRSPPWFTAYRDDGLTVDLERRYDTFARLTVTDGSHTSKVELGVDWRANEPILMAVGPVLHPDDAFANKGCGLRAGARA